MSQKAGAQATFAGICLVSDGEISMVVLQKGVMGLENEYLQLLECGVWSLHPSR